MNASLKNLVCLKSDGWEAYVLPSFGANLVHLCYQGREILRKPPDLSALAENPVLYGMPILMPPNRTAGGRFEFQGRTWSLPINEPAFHNHLHGRFYDASFAILEQSENHVACSIKNSGAYFPFPCQLTCRILLEDCGLKHELTIQNTGHGPMPLVVGFHTNFARPHHFSVPIGKRWGTDENHIPTGKLIDLDSHERRFRDGMNPEGQIISGFFTATGRTALIDSFEYSVSEPFDQWILFNGHGQDFLSIEPQVGPVNALNQPGSYPILDPGSEKTLTSTIRHRNNNT